MRSKSPLPLATLINTKRISLAIVLALGSGALISCGGGGDSARVAQTVDASKNGVTRIELEDNEGYAHFKGTLQLNLNGRNSENALTNLNSKASWKLSDTSLGSIRNGLFTAAGKPGELIVTAEYAGLSTTQNIIVSDANLISISVTPANSSVDECKNASFTANALFDNGLTLEYPLTWAITEGATLASFNDDTKGELSTKNSGTVSIVARGKNNSDETISSPVLNFPINDSLVSVALRSDKTLNMREGESATVTLTGTYSDNSTAVITSNSNLTAAPSASLTIEGAKITAKNGSYAGTDVVLTGSCGGQTNDLTIVVLKKQIKSIEIKNSNGGSDNLSVTEGGNLDLNITATFADDSTDSNYDYKVNWSIVDSKSDDFDDDLITLDQTGKLTISGDLNLALNQQLKLVVRAEVRDENDKVVTNAQGQQLVDEINIVVRP